MNHHRPGPGFPAAGQSTHTAEAAMPSVPEDLLWLLLDDVTGRLLTDRRTTGRALTVAARGDMGGDVGHDRSRIASARRLRRSLEALHNADRVRRRGIRLGGVVPYTVWPTVDPAGKRAVRATLERALFDARPPGNGTRTLIAVLHAVDALWLQCPRWSRRETDYWARQFVAQHDDCGELAESLHALDREALADAFSFGARPLFVPRSGSR
ncbi:GPP34 family phosphoprotein [Nocardia nova]|uniref:GPP34 family phosphoprotein n=1 Tax=Nocardia nova TaxID=37330 RepID=UPI0033F961FE